MALSFGISFSLVADFATGLRRCFPGSSGFRCNGSCGPESWCPSCWRPVRSRMGLSTQAGSNMRCLNIQAGTLTAVPLPSSNGNKLGINCKKRETPAAVSWTGTGLPKCPWWWSEPKRCGFLLVVDVGRENIGNPVVDLSCASSGPDPKIQSRRSASKHTESAFGDWKEAQRGDCFLHGSQF